MTFLLKNEIQSGISLLHFYSMNSFLVNIISIVNKERIRETVSKFLDVNPNTYY